MFHKRLIKEFPENKKKVVAIVVSQWIMLLANCYMVYSTATLLTAVLEKRAEKQQYAGYIFILIIVLAVRALMNRVMSKFSFQASTLVKQRLREKIFDKLIKLSSGRRDVLKTSEAVQLSTEGVEQLEIYFGKYVPQFFYSLLAPLTLFVFVGTMSLKTAAVLLLCVPLIPVSIIAVQKFAKKLLNKYWGTYTGLGDSFLEGLMGLTTLKIYEADELYAGKMQEEAEKFRKVTMKVLIMQLNSISVMDLIAFGGSAAGIILSLLEFRNGSINITECFFIIVISAEFFLPLRLLGSYFHIAMNGNSAADKIFTLFDLAEEEKGKFTEIKGSEVRFSNVSFSYGAGEPVLKQVSFQLNENSFTAMAGTSGCGKSTIASLILGEQCGYAGTITIGGVDIRTIAPEALYKKVTRIRHDSYLFQGTVKENLKVGNEQAEDQEMISVLKQVELWEELKQKGGLLFRLTEKAANLSGGQRQRLALARALLHQSDIYIFDEAASNIDVESEDKIMQVIKKLAEEKTVLLISHRLSNLVDSDKILVMKQGSVKESGTHADLLNRDGNYKAMFEHQMKLETYGRMEG